MAARSTQYRKVGPALVDQRRDRRHRVVISSATLCDDISCCDATLHDLSLFGCRLVSATRRRAGERLMLGFEGSEPRTATVVWTDEQGFVGCRFDEPLDRALVRALTLVIC